MALSELTSNLSWYGSNAGFRAQQSANQTRFNQDPGDLTVAVAPRGFDNAGNQSNAFMAKMSGNAFNIDGQGTATRLSQLGEGTKFPIGPEGQVHQFDIKRTGFSVRMRYADTFNNKTLNGLASTYTDTSPIDDMYNKFKVRDEVYDPFGYAKPPFILRGIQRDGSSKPQRWGLGDTTAGVISSLLDIPRGGPLVMGDRILNDAARLGKMLIRPQGLAFIAKQQLLHLMSPNTEGDAGIVSVNYATNQKLSNPLNTIASALGSPLGVRFIKHGLVPFGIGIPTYSDIHTKRDNASLTGLPVNVTQNRLVLMLDERNNLPPGYWLTIGGPAGPNSVGGIGATTFRKRTEYDTRRVGTTLQRSIDYDKGRRFATQYFSTRPYFGSNETVDIVDNRELPLAFVDQIQLLDPTAKESLRTRIEKNDFDAIPKREVNQAASNESPPNTDLATYKTLSYGQIRTARESRTYKSTQILDLSTGEKFSAKDTPIGKRLTEAKVGFTADKDKTLVEVYEKLDSDYVTFKIGSEQFRSFISSISLSDNVSSAQQKEMMAPYPQYYFDSHDRTGSIAFIIAVMSANALTAAWDKVKKLQSLCGPVVSANTSGALRVQTTTLTLGNIFKDTAIILDTVNFDIDNESPWEITAEYQRPMYINVDISFTILPTSKTSLPTFS